MLPIKCRHFFSASTFLKFDRDEYGRIDIIAFFHSIVRKVNLFQTRIQISLYDSIGNGYLREKDLENYIFELIPIFS
jgi:serine/threonine-protein phosphatase 2A regulatory subunit B''